MHRCVYTTITLEGHHFFVTTRNEHTKKYIALTSFINIIKANEMLFNFLFHSVVGFFFLTSLYSSLAFTSSIVAYYYYFNICTVI